MVAIRSSDAREAHPTERIRRLGTEPPVAAPSPRRVLGARYELHHEIGAGGMATVYAARDLLLERAVAVKLLDPCSVPHAVGVERIRREAAALALIESAHVVGVHDLGVGADTYLVMQLVRGHTLAEEVMRFGAVPVPRACRIVLDVLAGLAAVHRAGLVHRDLKPTNVMLDRDDSAVLLDLGVALHHRRRPLTPPGMAIGTPEQMAPEQRDGAPLDGRTDLFQAGLLLAYLVGGQDVDARTASSAAITAALPHAIAPVVARALAPIEDRYPTAFDMGVALQAACASDAPRRTRPWSIVRSAVAALF